MEKLSCCICYEDENKLSFITCDQCKEGNICCECAEEYEHIDNQFYLLCPCCRSVNISHTKRNIIFFALFYNLGVPNDNNLFNRWRHNFINADDDNYVRVIP